MPRNGSGTYTLPAGNPVVAGTTIDASWANTTLNDVATELTNSLSRTGAGGMLAPFRIADGSITAPGLAFLNETNSGLYRSGAGNVRMAVLGVYVMQWSSTGILIPDGILLEGQCVTPTASADVANKSYVDSSISSALSVNSRALYTATAGQTTFAITYNVGTLDAYINGVKQASSTFTATNGASVVFSTPMLGGETVDLVGNSSFVGGTYLATTGGTMTGAIAMGNNKITGLGTPTVGTDAVTKTYADTMLPKAGGTMTGDIAFAATQTFNRVVQVIGTNTAAVAGKQYVLTASLTLTLPATPTAGQTVGISNLSGTTTAVVGRNGNNIQGLGQDLTIDTLNAAITLMYADATRGWVFV